MVKQEYHRNVEWKRFLENVSKEPADSGMRHVETLSVWGYILNTPPEFFSDIYAFAKRNSIPVLNSDGNGDFSVCERCLKAHIANLASLYKIPADVKDFLLKTFECETGHLGHYIDSGELHKVPG